MELKQFLTYTGMLVVIFGAIFEVVGLLKTKRNTIIKQASTFWGYNPQLYISLTEQKIRAIAGFVCIFLGFIFQFMVAILDENFMSKYYVPNELVVLSYIFILCTVLYMISLKIRVDVNYYLIPNDVSQIKQHLIDIQQKSGDDYTKYEEIIINKVIRVAEGLKIKHDFMNLSSDREKIDELIKTAEKCIDKHEVYSVTNCD